MNTSRVPGFTRNSGWQAVASEIARDGERRRHQGEVTASTATPPADQAADGFPEQTGPRTPGVADGP